jgi:DNA helicase-2/ATP-dependent DNA helicase PcrA
MKLNEEQTAAVQHPLDQPACLIAGAGSGKTRVLTERVRWLIDNGVPAGRICALTFTNKAAGELIHRLELDSKKIADTPRVSTIHALALSGIRKNPPAFGLKDRVTPLDDYDQKQMVKKIIERHKFEIDTAALMFRLLEKISFHRARGIGFHKEYTDDVHELALRNHAGYHAMDEQELELWEEFEREKKDNSVVDFDDMLHLVVRRMRTDPKWLASLHKQFDHVLMDEAQDTNPVQWEFINGLLHPDNRNMYVVGDMSQSIYGFSGAVPELLKKYSEKWRGLVPALYRIARNHRSVPEIVDFANLIQKKMTRTLPLKMESWRGSNDEHGDVRKLLAPSAQLVAANIALEIQRDGRKDIPFKDNALLVRSAIQIRDLEGELIKRRIPYIVRGGRGLLTTEEVRDVLAYMRLAANHQDFTAFMRAAGAPRCGVGDVGLEKLRRQAIEEFDGDLISAGRKVAKLHPLCDIIEHVSLFKEAPVAAVEKIVAMSNYKEYVRQKYKKEPGKVQGKLENIERFAMLVIVLVRDNNLTLDDLIFQLTLDRPKGDEAEERDAVLRAFEEGKIDAAERDAKLQVIDQGSVTITTIHSAKGLEWRRVYVTNLVEGSLPHKFSLGSEDEIEEERRLFYVACTRARDLLVWCVPERQQSPDGTRLTRLVPSRFLLEIGV